MFNKQQKSAKRKLLTTLSAFLLAGVFSLSGVLSAAPVTASTSIGAPNAVSYIRSTNVPYCADGRLTITHPTSGDYDSFVAYWGNANGKLADYTPLVTVEASDGETTQGKIKANTVIPESADRILVYSYSGTTPSAEYATVMLASGVGNSGLGTPIAEIQVISDIHVQDKADHVQTGYNDKVKDVFNDIKRISPNSSGIFVNGDVVEWNPLGSYVALQEILAECELVTGEDIHFGVGNHDFLTTYGAPGGTYVRDAETKEEADALPFEYLVKRFFEGTRGESYTYSETDTVYFDGYFGAENEYQYIFIGTENPEAAKGGGRVIFTEAQMTWLDEKLSQATEDKPVFLFLHEGLNDTVSGTFRAGAGVFNPINSEEEAKLIAVLEKHSDKNIIMFAAHSHARLEDSPTIKFADRKLPTIVTNGAIQHITHYTTTTKGENTKESQGWFIDVYEDKLVLKGYNFTTNEWVSSAQFVLNIPVEIPDSEPTLTIASATVQPDKDLGIDYFLPVANVANCTDIYAQATFLGKEYFLYPETDTEIVNGQECYVFSFNDISPAQMGDEVSLCAYATVAGTEYVGEAFTYSVKNYCFDVLADETASRALKTLAVETLNYGAQSQIYTRYNTSALVNADLTDEQKGYVIANVTLENASAQSIDGDESVAKWQGVKLLLSDSITVRFVFTAKSEIGLTATVRYGNDLNKTEEITQIVALGKGRYAVDFSVSSVEQLNNLFEITIADVSGNTSKTLTYSVESYAYAVQDVSAAGLNTYTAALMKYLRAVDAYQAL